MEVLIGCGQKTVFEARVSSQQAHEQFQWRESMQSLMTGAVNAVSLVARNRVLLEANSGC